MRDALRRTSLQKAPKCTVGGYLPASMGMTEPRFPDIDT